METLQLTNHNSIIEALDRFVCENNELETKLNELQRVGISISYKADDETPTFLDIVATTKFDFQSSGNAIVLFENTREIVIWDCESARIETETCEELGKDIIHKIEIETNDEKGIRVSLEQLYFLDHQKDE